MMHKAEKVFQSFVEGDTMYMDSPLLTVQTWRPHVLMHRIPVGREKIVIPQVCALRYEGVLIYSDALDAKYQVHGMLRRAKATVIPSLDFAAIFSAMNDHLNSFDSVIKLVNDGPYTQSINRLMGLCLAAKRNNLPWPFGDDLTDMLAYINHRFCEGRFTCVLSGLLKSQRSNYVFNGDDGKTDTMSLMGIPGFTFFVDETEALMLLLADTRNRVKMFKLPQRAGA